MLIKRLKRYCCSRSGLRAVPAVQSGRPDLRRLCCGAARPYRQGVVTEGAYADPVLVDGDPPENLDLVADPNQNFVVIMRDGKNDKNTR